MNELTVFNSNEFGAIRTKTINGEPWFVGKDVADALGYSETNAMTKRLDSEDFISDKLADMNMYHTLINESGLYTAIIGSKLPTAKKFKHWVTSEVLPTIRKTGGYVANEQLFVDTYLPFADDTTKQMFAVTLDTLRQQNKLIEQQKQKIALDAPLVDFANQVASSADCIDMGTFAKMLYDEGIDIGRNRLFKWLKKNKVLMSNNSPYQQYMQYFKVVETTYKTAYGTKIGYKTTINGKGQIFFTEKLRKMYVN